jgi:hypothetical protein
VSIERGIRFALLGDIVQNSNAARATVCTAKISSFAKNIRIAESSCRPAASSLVIFAIAPRDQVVLSG